jgi:hypothetical protein
MLMGESNSASVSQASTARAADRKATLVVHLIHGIGNRLSGLLSCMVLAEVFGMELQVCWERDPIACDAEFGELFEADALDDIEFRDSHPEGVAWIHYGDVTKERVENAISQRGSIYIRAFNLFGETIVGHFHFYERLRAHLSRLRPVRAVLEIVEEVPRAAVGIHIRMTDHLPSRVVTPLWCYRAALIQVLARRPDDRVYVCSDTPRVVSELVRVDPRRVCTTPPRSLAGLPRSSLPALQYALAEIWLLSRCSTIFGAPPSSFALLASLFSGGTFIRLSAWPKPLAWRVEAVMWPIYRAVSYDLKGHRWRMKENQGLLKMPLVAGSWVATTLLCSKWYQERPLPFQRRMLLRRLAGTI